MTVDELVTYFESLTPQTVAQMGRYYTESAYFKDPFNEVRNLKEIQRIFSHMFDTLIEPRFVVMNRVVEGGQVVLEWDFRFYIRSYQPNVARSIHGVSHLRLGPDGRVQFHRDYWDTGEELFSHLPIAGMLIRFLRARMKTPGTGA